MSLVTKSLVLEARRELSIIVNRRRSSFLPRNLMHICTFKDRVCVKRGAASHKLRGKQSQRCLPAFPSPVRYAFGIRYLTF